MERVNLLQEGKLSLHSLTGYPTCEQARVYSTKARQNVSSSSDLKKKKRKEKTGFFYNYLDTNNNTEKQGFKVKCANNRCECSDLHTEVRHTAGHKGIWVNVFMTGQKRKEKKCTAFLYGILHTFTIKTVWCEDNAHNNREVQQNQHCFSRLAHKDHSGSSGVKTSTETQVLHEKALLVLFSTKR